MDVFETLAHLLPLRQPIHLDRFGDGVGGEQPRKPLGRTRVALDHQGLLLEVSRLEFRNFSIWFEIS